MKFGKDPRLRRPVRNNRLNQLRNSVLDEFDDYLQNYTPDNTHQQTARISAIQNFIRHADYAQLMGIRASFMDRIRLMDQIDMDLGDLNQLNELRGRPMYTINNMYNLDVTMADLRNMLNDVLYQFSLFVDPMPFP